MSTIQAVELEELELRFEEKRLITFQNWPFAAPAKCTAEAMAQAGFYHPANESPDSAKCFFCCKELDGWEPDDDPWEEHVQHTRGKCDFLKHAEGFESLSVYRSLELEIKRQSNITRDRAEKLKQQLKDQAQVVRNELSRLLD